MKNSIAHGGARRYATLESLGSLSGNKDPGLFGRMFPKLKPLKIDDAELLELAKAMKDDPADGPSGDNHNVPAGFTYLGQFVDHDITLDTTPLDQQHVDPLGVENFRSPKLDLDSVYGQGPGVSPHLYARKRAGGSFPLTAKLLIGKTEPTGDDGKTNKVLPNDLPRNAHGRALIGDERNDENLLVAQTHLAFLKFHNAVVDHLVKGGAEESSVFEEAKRVTTWHYQWLVLYDFVERITEPGLIDRIRHEGRKYYRFKTTPYMPVEFSAAVYRLGHSMVRESYRHNKHFDPTGFGLLFLFTGKSGDIAGDLGGFPTLPSNWVINWHNFHETKKNSKPVNASRKLDPLIAPELHTLPGEQGSFANLAFRNLKRGVNLGLPSGQDVAKAMRVSVLSADEMASGNDGKVAKKHGMHKKTPLWYYILKEAQIKGDGDRLGPVGCRIIAEVFLGIVHGDQNSFLWQRSNWSPELPSAKPGKFTMADMINFIGDQNPLGN